ncbi:hypothetical protein [Pseudomonas sp. 1928-m]|uniref:hypothetical protein n=1 Tax=Pseudomonas sp. 1928-m TaxID=3033804 RepID=UPI0023DE8458|nr:hypothetical protein [Pseudomonas sp. 1928-m]MDF3196338.1 hypothetical protein [Pseudomonas sp. 1928-m]
MFILSVAREAQALCFESNRRVKALTGFPEHHKTMPTTCSPTSATTRAGACCRGFKISSGVKACGQCLL